VATPSDLIRDKTRSPFNIGQAIHLAGLALAEAMPLAQGLAQKTDNAQVLLKEILAWTGGQPFLTQKICKLVLMSSLPIPAGDEGAWVENLVRTQVIENWEANDEPEHLKTIRDRILWSQRKGQLLQLYYQILQQGEVKANDLPEQKELRLSGLVVKQQGKLRAYNRIYESIFNQSWVENALAEVRLLPDIAQTLAPSRTEIQALESVGVDALQRPDSQEIKALLSSVELREERHKQKRAYEIIQVAFLDWLNFEKQDYYLLDKHKINLLLQYVIHPHLSFNLLNYIFCSISYVFKTSTKLEIRLLKTWISRIDSIEIIDLLKSVLENRNSEIRLGAVRLIQKLEENKLIDFLISRIKHEKNSNLKREIIQCIYTLGGHLPHKTAQFILENELDWVIQSYALRNLEKYRASLLISDGTEFANTIGSIAQSSGFELVSFTTFSSEEITEYDVLNSHELVILVRGEHFSQYGNEKFYSKLIEFVFEGGKLFATSWVSWENKYNESFSMLLPFTHIGSRYQENVTIICRPAASELAKRLFPNQMSFRTSFELLKPRDGSVVLLESDNHIPIFGYRHFGSGCCYYLNSCQHSCLGSILSPLQTSSELHDSLKQVFEWIFNSPRKSESEAWRTGE
jgi:hypothetical protein